MMHWHAKHAEGLSQGEILADKIAAFIGSWAFIVGQSIIMTIWVFVNVLTVFHFIQFDEYPFVFLNLFMSAEAAYATPLILMAQNRQSDRDRHHAEEDYQVNLEAEQRIEALQTHLHQIEDKKLDMILADHKVTKDQLEFIYALIKTKLGAIE